MENEKEIIDNSASLVEETSKNDVSTHVGEGEVSTESADTLELEEGVKSIDYNALSKKDFVDLLKEAVKDTDFRKIDGLLKETKLHFDEIRTKEREEALQKFIQNGGRQDDFEYRSPEVDVAFEANYKLLRDKRNQFYRDQEEQKNTNLQRKTDLLEKLRQIVDAEDSEQSFHALKELQKEWKAIGAVPNAHIKPLWANYTALIDRFYDNRSIYFELKELDRKKNLEAKLELCARAERLLDEPQLSTAVRELNDLHNEFRHVGPVPKDDKEAVWQRFKKASDAIYQKRDAHLEKVNQELNKNLEIKLQLADEAVTFASYNTDRIKEWNQKTQDILALQKKWEAVGAIPRAKSKDVNKKFWTSFKSFFHTKNAFFKKLDEERTSNLALKEEIVRKAEELKQSSDWEGTAESLKELQRQWKEVGPVPEKMREKIYARFKEACDYFFEQRRTQFDKQDEEQNANLQKKEAICEELEKLAESKAGSREKLNELVDSFNAIGFVPKKAINASRSRFQKAVNLLVDSLQGLSEEERENIHLEAEVGNLRNDPQGERKIYQKEQHIRKKIQKAENDLAVLKNNLEFFGRSKNAAKMKDEFNGKIQEATDHLSALKNQLKLLKTVS